MCKVSLHAITDNGGEDVAKNLNQRQRPVIGQAAICATVVNIMHKANVPSSGSDLRELYLC